jgi:hypothetical protein
MRTNTPDVDTGDGWDVPPDTAHVCLIYDSDAQRDVIVARYLVAGLRRGELLRYFADVTAPEVVRSWLAVSDPDALEEGRIRIMAAEDAYCPDGQFDPRRVIDAFVPGYARARTAGFPGVRTTSEMTWTLRGIPGSERVVEYEALINTVPDTFPHVGMCQYDARRFDGATLFQVLRVHPHMVAGGLFVRNPDYVRPEVFLAEMGLDS